MNGIRKMLGVTLLGLILFSASEARAIESRFLTADTLAPGRATLGAAVSFTDDFIFAFPTARYGIADGIEIGGKIGLIDSDLPRRGDTGVHLGVDAKLRLWNDVPRLPLDIAMDVGYNFSGVASKTLHEWELMPLMSKRLEIPDSSIQPVPYGAIEILGINGSLLEHDVQAFGIAGVDWRFTDRFSAQTEIKFGDRTVGGVGIRMTF